MIQYHKMWNYKIDCQFNSFQPYCMYASQIVLLSLIGVGFGNAETILSISWVRLFYAACILIYIAPTFESF